MTYEEIAKRCRHRLLGYDDGQPAGPADIEQLLDLLSKDINSYAQSVSRLQALLNQTPDRPRGVGDAHPDLDEYVGPIPATRREPRHRG